MYATSVLAVIGALVALASASNATPGPLEFTRPTNEAASPVQASPLRLSIAQAVRISQERSPAILSSLADRQAARQATLAARAKRLPQLSVNGFAVSGSYGSIFSSSPRVDPAYLLGTSNGSLLDANLTAMAPLYTGGLIEAQIQSARSLESASGGDASETMADVALSVTDAYLRTLLARENEIAQAARVRADEELVGTTQALFDAGKGLGATVSRVKAELAGAKRSRASSQNEAEKALLDLKAAMGIDLDMPVELTERLDTSPGEQDLSSYITSSRSKRGSLLSATARLKSALADLRAAEAMSKPQLYGVAMADTASQRLNRGSSIGLTVSVPLFDGGERRAEASRMSAMRIRAAAALRSVELTIEREVRAAFLDLSTAKENRASADAAVASAEDALRVVTLRVSNGKGILVEQLDSIQALSQARADLAQAMYDYRIATARVERAAGISTFVGDK